jgi:hypothetical protein
MKNLMRKVNISILSIFIFIGAIGIPRTVDAKTISLFKKSMSNIEIVKPSSATDFENQAAKNLKEYLEKVTNSSIEIKPENEVIEKIPIYVGRCLASQHLVGIVEALTNDGYAIEIEKDSIHLLGKNDLATRFAVYGFLEDYIDVHWFLPEVWGDDFPENMGTYIPQNDTIRLKTTLDVQDPSFKYRHIGKKESRDEQWTICNKMNFIDHDDHGFQTNTRAHSFFKYVHPHDYYDFSEYFRMLDGEFLDSVSLENMEVEEAKRIKLNIGNPEVKVAMVDKIVETIDNQPKYEIITLFPNDGLKFCESPESKIMDGHNYENFTVEMVNDTGRNLGNEFGRVLSKRYTVFYHDVTEMILSQRPDKLLRTGAYSAYNYAPLEVTDPAFVSDYKMDARVMLYITHSWEHNHPIMDRSTAPNQYFDDSIEGWKRLYSNFGVYEYYRKLAMNELPFPIIHSIRYDIPYYYNNRFSLFYTQYSFEDIGTYGLNYYIAAQLIWDINADVDKLLKDFYTKFYGKAAAHMRLYHETLEKAAIRSNLELSPKYYGAFLDLFTVDVLKKCTMHLENAKEAVQENYLWSKRVELSEISLNYTKKVIDYLSAIRSLFDIDNGLIWRTLTEEEIANVKEKAEEMADVISESGPYQTIVDTKYTERLRQIRSAISSVRRYFHGEVFTKNQWIEKNHIKAQDGYGDVEAFDIWIYANDIDYNSTNGPEHQINIIDKFGQSTEIAQLARNQTERGNRIDKGFMIHSFSFEDLVGSNDSITLEVLNYPGGFSNSTFYALAIMPHMDDLSQDNVTWYYQNDVNFIRRNSFGFIEFEKDNRDNEPFTVDIDLFSHK